MTPARPALPSLIPTFDVPFYFFLEAKEVVDYVASVDSWPQDIHSLVSLSTSPSLACTALFLVFSLSCLFS
jgi:hypothetical protein